MTSAVSDNREDLRHGWKILTHDYRSPIRGGERLFDGRSFPCHLGPVALDTGPAECAAGLHYVADLPAALRLAGLWPTGYPSTIYRVQASADALQRGNKRRASELTLLRRGTEAEITAAIVALSAPFGKHAAAIAGEQVAWRRALARPGREPVAVETGLRQALDARSLPWHLRRFDSARDAGAAWAAGAAGAAGAAWAAWAAWDAWAARDARAAWVAWDARAAGAAWDAGDAWAAGAAWAAWDARAAGAAWAAWDSMALCYAALRGWITHSPDLLCRGLRDAYAAGLAIAVPTAQDELGWALEPAAERIDDRDPEGQQP